jgi:restriction endonuclease S subunit
MEHLEAGQWEEPQGVEVSGSDIKSQVIAFHPGLVLYGKLRPYLNKVFVPSYEGIASSEFVPIAPHPSLLSPKYLAAYLRTPGFAAYANANTTGSRQPRVRLEALWSVLLPLPPLAEQERIVERLEALMDRVREARRLREQAREEAERLWQSVLADTFPRPGSALPPGWRWVRLGEVCTTRSGNSKMIKGRLHSQPAPGLFPGYSASGQDVWLSGFEHEGQAIILSAVGARCGKCFLADGNWTAIANTHIIWPNQAKIDVKFLFHLLNDETFWIRGQSAQPFVKVGESKKNPIPLPPLAEQRRIIERLEALQEKLRALQAAQAETEEQLKHLEQSILDKAFRGQL